MNPGEGVGRFRRSGFALGQARARRFRAVGADHHGLANRKMRVGECVTAGTRMLSMIPIFGFQPEMASRK